MPREVHYPEYDEAGTLIRTVVVREPEWDQHERALMLAHFSNMADQGPYGVPLSRATAKDAFFRAKEFPTENKAVTAVLRRQKAYFEEFPQMREFADSLMWSVSEVTD